MIRLTIAGLGEVVLDSVADLIELKKAFDADKKESGTKTAAPAAANQPVAPTTPAAPFAKPVAHEHENRNVLTAPHSRGDYQETLKFLEALRANFPRPTASEALYKTMRLKSAKGLGSVLSRVKSDLSRRGFEPDSVFKSQRAAFGREYLAGPNFLAAYAATASSAG